MNDQIRHILSQITELENDLHGLVHDQQIELHYRIEGTKVRFEESIKKTQRALRIGIIQFFRQSQLCNIITAPVIYSIIFPVITLDLWVTIYQSICFPLYRIPNVRRSRYIVIDRHSLTYLHSIEKFNCIYCGYTGGSLPMCVKSQPDPSNTGVPLNTPAGFWTRIAATPILLISVRQKTTPKSRKICEARFGTK